MKLPKGCPRVECKWIFKTKRDFHDNIEHYKTRLVAKYFTKKDGIDYKETFLSISKKDSFKIIMTLVTHCGLELHEMDVKISFMNENLEGDIYMDQPMAFIEKGSTWCLNLRNQYMDLNKLSGNDILSSMILLCSLNLRKISLIDVYI